MDFIPVGGYIYKDNEGYKGLILFRLLPDEFAVYERCCPYDPDKTGAMITADPSNTTCTCPVCGSKFILYDGSPYGGPSPYSLMQYRWDYDGEVLRVYN
jgi:nitrite reductase/ring-hydroxylating ferredoxin subunit